MTSRHATARFLRALGARVGILVAIAALVAGVLHGGKSYFSCRMMDTALDAPCCGNDDHEARDVSEFRAPDCCKARRVGTLPASAVSSVPDVAPSPCVATLPAVDVDASSLRRRAALMRFAQPARAGPPTANERRAELMVWLS